MVYINLFTGVFVIHLGPKNKTRRFLPIFKFCLLHTQYRSTQPSSLCGMVKWVSAFGLSNNKWRWVDVFPNRIHAGFMAQVGRALSGSRPVLLCIHRVNRVNSRNDCKSWWQYHKHCPGITTITMKIILHVKLFDTPPCEILMSEGRTVAIWRRLSCVCPYFTMRMQKQQFASFRLIFW